MSSTPDELTIIQNHHDLYAWFNGKPEYRQQIIATRAALRILPLVLRVFDIPNAMFGEEQKKKFVVATFRAAFVAWVEASYRETSFVHREILNDPSAAELRASVKSADDKRLLLIADAVAFSAVAVAFAAKSERSSGFIEAVDRAAFSIDFIIRMERRAIADTPDGVVDGEGVAADVVWKAITADIQHLEADESEDLMRRPLWLNDVRGLAKFKVNFPDWARSSYNNFARSGVGNRRPWNVWAKWYDGLLGSLGEPATKSAFGRKLDLNIYALIEKVWAQNSDVVMDYLSELTRSDNLEAPHIASTAKLHAPTLSSVSTDPEPENETDLDVTETVNSHSDEPADNDLLDRMFFAETLVSRIKQIREQGTESGNGGDGYAVHLHAPWGAGKTTLWRLMKKAFAEQRGGNEEQWITVEFNAWSHQRRRPPWWPFIRTVKEDCVSELRSFNLWWRSCKINSEWILWRARTDWMPYIAAPVVFMVVFLFFVATGKETTDWLLGIVSSLGVAIGAFILVARMLVFGSPDNAKAHADLLSDSLQGVRGLFNSLMENTDLPICVLIDDLDRCHAEYAVELLEGIQTAFRHRDVTYFVAADRAWLKAAYETVYKEFKSDVGAAAQPLGYLFLEKVFQVSTPLPAISKSVMEKYWMFLLNGDEEKVEQAMGEKVSDAREEIRASVGENPTRKGLDEFIDKHKSEPDITDDKMEAFAYAAGQAINESSKARGEALHELKDFVKIVSNNPRVMKRMLNAYGLLLSVAVRDRSSIPNRAIARWTILEQRFPALVDVLTVDPLLLDVFVKHKDGDKNAPDALEPFLENKQIRKVIVGDDKELRDDPLTTVHVFELTEGSRV